MKTIKRMLALLLAGLMLMSLAACGGGKAAATPREESAAMLRELSGQFALEAVLKRKAGKLSGVITQNIDGLHQAAGSKRVLELHGYSCI